MGNASVLKEEIGSYTVTSQFVSSVERAHAAYVVLRDTQHTIIQWVAYPIFKLSRCPCVSTG